MVAALAVSLGDFLGWKARAGKSLREEGILPCAPWMRVRRKNGAIIWTILVMSMAPMAYTMGQYSKKTLILVMAAFLFAKLLYWLRMKRAYSAKANMAIYWSVALVICAAACGGALAFIFWIV